MDSLRVSQQFDWIVFAILPKFRASFGQQNNSDFRIWLDFAYLYLASFLNWSSYTIYMVIDLKYVGWGGWKKEGWGIITLHGQLSNFKPPSEKELWWPRWPSELELSSVWGSILVPSRPIAAWRPQTPSIMDAPKVRQPPPFQSFCEAAYILSSGKSNLLVFLLSRLSCFALGSDYLSRTPQTHHAVSIRRQAEAN